MEKEIEYEETVKKQEVVTLCDDCGREVDDGGGKFYEARSGKGKIDLCSECCEKLNAGDDKPEVYIPVEDWKHAPMDNLSLESHYKSDRIAVLLCGGILLLAIAGLGYWFDVLFTLVYIIIVAYLFTKEKNRVEENLVHP